jgi:hypothetical protein
MALGDGIRRDLATVDAAERVRLRDAIVELNQRFFPGSPDDAVGPGGVTHWFKQDEIHWATHVHHGLSFLPWHRELCNRFEELLRDVDPDLSLHYWDWTTDPDFLFTPDFMGSANGDAGEPWLGAGFYAPGANPFRSDNLSDLFNGVDANPAHPPRTLSRDKSGGAPAIGSPGWWSDDDVISPAIFSEMAVRLEEVHDNMHSSYIGGTIGIPHLAFRDPFVFFMHSNVDRLFAMWQSVPGQEWRLDPAQVYGPDANDPALVENLEPWAGGTGTRPWAPPENEQVVKTSLHPSVVAPPCYDSLPTFPATVTRETEAISFVDIPEGEMTVRAAVFSVVSCGDVHFEITDGPTVLTGPPGTTLGTPLGGTDVVSSTTDPSERRARLWISYTGTSDGDVATGTVTVHCAETQENFDIPISANTIARPSVVVAMALDRSNSMNFDSGVDALPRRIDVLHFAAPVLVDVLQEGNGIGIVAFDHDPHDVFPVTPVGPEDDDFDPGRGDAKNAIADHQPNPSGNTAIGDGVEKAHQLLEPETEWDVKATIVLTDGHETASKRIDEVTDLIDPNQRIFAVGLGTAEEIQPAALQELCGGHQGYMEMTGLLDNDDRYRLTKYYLQILASVTNEDVVVDPEGMILPGQEHRIPFALNEADINADVILLLPAKGVIDLTLETPAGQVIDRAVAGATPGASFRGAESVSYYRMTLPVVVDGEDSKEGTWHAVLRVDRSRYKRYLASLEKQPKVLRSAAAHGIPYSLSAHSYSNLRMRAQLTQDRFEPGATLTLRAAVTEYGLPVERRARTVVEIERPDGTTAVVALHETEPGIFEAAIVASSPGVYRCHLRCRGATLRGLRFTREQLLTGAVWRREHVPPTRDPGDKDDQLCRLVSCLLEDEGVARWIAKQDVEPKALAECVRRACADRGDASE